MILYPQLKHRLSPMSRLDGGLHVHVPIKITNNSNTSDTNNPNSNSNNHLSKNKSDTACTIVYSKIENQLSIEEEEQWIKGQEESLHQVSLSLIKHETNKKHIGSFTYDLVKSNSSTNNNNSKKATKKGLHFNRRQQQQSSPSNQRINQSSSSSFNGLDESTNSITSIGVDSSDNNGFVQGIHSYNDSRDISLSGDSESDLSIPRIQFGQIHQQQQRVITSTANTINSSYLSDMDQSQIDYQDMEDEDEDNRTNNSDITNNSFEQEAFATRREVFPARFLNLNSNNDTITNSNSISSMNNSHLRLPHQLEFSQDLSISDIEAHSNYTNSITNTVNNSIISDGNDANSITNNSTCQSMDQSSIAIEDMEDVNDMELSTVTNDAANNNHNNISYRSPSNSFLPKSSVKKKLNFNHYNNEYDYEEESFNTPGGVGYSAATQSKSTRKPQRLLFNQFLDKDDDQIKNQTLFTNSNNSIYQEEEEEEEEEEIELEEQQEEEEEEEEGESYDQSMDISMQSVE
ncbi:hypothetical protein CYY_003078 [Polysphondylium violaceum]|uniref:Uncharacterized protein n=1 Tax=Polysphondylium violaceum TaxID=133409 RepID=A0A8J4PXP3_9MYCE|nr:hypothetical protein CYY_003078 [Polysphondylium violaceum]